MKKREIIIYGIITSFAIFLSFWYLIDVKIGVIFSLISLGIIGHVIYKEHIDREVIIALLLALIITSYYTYEYTSLNLYAGKINVFPLVSWIAVLVVLREFYKKIRLEKKYKFLIASCTYIVILFVLEAVGYYFLNIKLASHYPSLFGLGIIHAPLGMKFFYLTAGPLYLILTEFLKVK